MAKEKIRVLIADSHDLFRQGLASLLARQPGIEIVGEATDGDEAHAMTGTLKPDVLRMEVNMRRSEGLPTVMHIIESYPETNVAVLTSSEDDSDVLAAGKLGIRGY